MPLVGAAMVVAMPLVPLAGHFLQLLPLVRRQHFAKPKQHPGVGLLQIRARLRDHINLPQHLMLVQIVRLQQRMQRGLFLLQRGVQLL